MSDLFAQLVEFLSIKGIDADTAFAAFASILTLIAGVLSAVARSSSAKQDSQGRNFDATSSDPEDASRVKDLRAALRKNRAVFRWSSLASTLFTFGQFVIGGLLASSYVQGSLTKEILGLLGVMVLLSSLINQTYRPDLHASLAKQRISKAKQMILVVEDALFELDEGETNSPTILEIRKYASNGLAQLEDNELDGYARIIAMRQRDSGEEEKVDEQPAYGSEEERSESDNLQLDKALSKAEMEKPKEEIAKSLG